MELTGVNLKKMGTATVSVAAIGVPPMASARETSNETLNTIAPSDGRRDTDQCARDARAPISNSCLYECSVMHHRLAPKKHFFQHAIFMFYLDLDELDSIARKTFLFSRNRWNLYTFRDDDHLPLGSEPARQRFGLRWVRGEGTHRFGSDHPQTNQSGVSPVPRQPPHSKTSRTFARPVATESFSTSLRQKSLPISRATESSLIRAVGLCCSRCPACSATSSILSRFTSASIQRVRPSAPSQKSATHSAK